MLLQFRACVDASPVLDTFCERKIFYVGCQGGLLQRICAKTGEVLSYHDFAGWMIQAACLVLIDSIIVCAHKANDEKGTVVALDKNLNEIKWEKQVNSCIKATPVLIDGTFLVQAGNKVFSYDSGTGKEVSTHIELPTRVIASVAVLPQNGGTAYYARADWDCNNLRFLLSSLPAVHLVLFTKTLSLSIQPTRCRSNQHFDCRFIGKSAFDQC